MRIDLSPDPLISAAQRREITELSERVYPADAPPNWSMSRTEWAPQTIRALVWDDGRLVCHVGALVRSALLNGETVLVGGVGGVMTAPAVRRKGYATAALAAMRRHLVDDQKAAFSMLFCAATLYRFYGKLDWRLFAGAVIVEQFGEPTAFTLNQAMLQDGQEIAPADGRLDLRGPPW